MALNALSKKLFLNDLASLIRSHPIASLLGCLLLICIFNRYWSSKVYSQIQEQDVTKEPAMLPHSVPYLGHFLAYLREPTKLYNKARDESKDGVVSLCLAGQKQYVVVMPSLIKQVFAQREAVLSNRSVAYQLAKNIFGDGGITAKIPGIYEHITSNLDILLTETALTEASNRTASQVGMSVSSLISFNSETSAQNLWERGSNLKILSGKLADTEVEVNLFHLVTRWTYWCATPAIFGSAFLDQNPSVMDDLFVFDEEFVSFMAGLPAFNTKLVRARSALDRSKKAIQVWYDAFQAVEDGRDPGPGWGNMQDINELVRVQLRTWREGGKEVEKAAHANLLSLLWGLHTNSDVLAFWALCHLYSSPSVLAMARAEASNYITQVSSEQYALDHTALCRNCPILKSTWLETIRQDTVGFEVKSILEDLTITESYEDAALLRGPEATPRSYLLRAGNSLSIPNNTAHNDRRFWENPEQFNASRFIVQDPRHEKGERAEWPRNFYGFGGGHTMCKGRLFAEKETLMFMAAFISFWDVEYLGPKDSAGNWLIKKGRVGGVALPAGEVRVRMTKRKTG